VAALLATPLGLTSSLGSLVPLLLIAPPLLVAALWAATKYSTGFMIGSVLILTLIPIDGFPYHELLHPGVVGLTVIAYAGLIGLLARRQPHMTMIDVAALVVLAGCALSVAYGHQTKANFEHVFFLWFCPYFAARSITGSGNRTAVLKAFAVAGAVAIPFGIVEITYGNLFIKAFPFGTEPQYGVGVPTQRLGINRAQGALGQPIPYSMFLSIAAVAAITLWIARTDRHSHRWLYIGLGIVAIQATTLSRTGWLMFAVVGGLVIALNFKTVFNYANRRLIVAGALGLIVIFAFPKTNELILGSSGSESAKLEDSADYRSRLISRALQPDYIDPYGTTESQIGPFGSKSIDDEYINAAWIWGYLPLVGFALMFLAFVRGAWRQRRDIVALVIYATCIATSVALESVAFLSQQQVLIWVLWGCASGLTVQQVQRKRKPVPYALSLRIQQGRLATGSEDRQHIAVL
jgi:hypothetical protein